MGVYINMEMPESCEDCPMAFSVNFGILCTPTHNIIGDSEISKKQGFCPLVPVPPHGDLIDRDALRASIRESIEECHKWADEVDKDTMMYARISQSLGTFVECSLRAKAAPTIIPADTAEEGET